MVRMPISLRGPMACFMAGCREGANRKAMPSSRRQRTMTSAGTPILTPSASSTSALPHLLDTLRLPCLATVTPAPATTKAAAVEMLNVCKPSPPVPQVSTTVPGGASTAVNFSRMARALPAMTSAVSPRMRRAVMKEAICAGVASPAMISRRV
jgi:hypothetical protein